MTAKMKTTSKLLALLMIFQMLMPAMGMSMSEDKSTLPLPASGNVTLTLAEYDRLVDLAARSVKKHETPPIAYTIKHAELKLRAGNDSVLGTVLEEGEVFSKSAAKVPLTSGLTIFNARQQGRTLPLFEEGSMVTAVLPGGQEFSVTLDTGLPLILDVGRASFSLPAPAAGSVRLSLVIPGDHANVRISPGLITSRTSENGQTTVEATLAPGQPANVWWTTREVVAPVVPKEVRFLSDVKTLVSVGEDSLRVAVLADVTVVQGQPTEFKLNVPTDYEITDVSGATVDGSEISDGQLTVKLSASAPRSHQFLISMEKQLAGVVKVETPFIGFDNTQRETGEVLVESAAAMEMTVKEGGGLKRMDLKEANPYLRSLSRFPLQAAFRFHRQPNEAPQLGLEWVRFPDSTVLAAVAERAVVTTMVTTEGRSLTEVKLTVKNQAQPFLKVDLPQGASILSADVAGEKVKPVQGPDGARVPLLRAGFRPTGAYEVSFVFLHSGAPFAKKGGSELSLPPMDVPISVLEWEVYLPEQYKVKDFGGDAISASFFPNFGGDEAIPASITNTFSGTMRQNFSGVQENQGLNRLSLFVPGVVSKSGSNEFKNENGGGSLGTPRSGAIDGLVNSSTLLPGQLGGVVLDPQGAVISGAQVKVTSLEEGIIRMASTDSNGRWVVFGMPSGTVKIEAIAKGFKSVVYDATPYDASHPRELGTTLSVGSATTTVEVTAAAPTIETTQAQVTNTFNPGRNGAGSGGGYSYSGGRKDRDKEKKQQAEQPASANVFNLQKKVAGVLPVRVDVPRAGSSYRFARALVLDEETKLTFSYRTK
jgi:Carboxypeptidase regulatory-like domain